MTAVALDSQSVSLGLGRICSKVLWHSGLLLKNDTNLSVTPNKFANFFIEIDNKKHKGTFCEPHSGCSRHKGNALGLVFRPC